MLKVFSKLARGIAVVGDPSRRAFHPDAEFERSLYAAEVERHRAILDREDASIPRNPPGWSALDDDSPRGRGFFPLAEAARRMGLSEDETMAMCERTDRASNAMRHCRPYASGPAETGFERQGGSRKVRG